MQQNQDEQYQNISEWEDHIAHYQYIDAQQTLNMLYQTYDEIQFKDQQQQSFYNWEEQDISVCDSKNQIKLYADKAQGMFENVLKNSTGVHSQGFSEIQSSLEILNKHMPQIFSQDLIDSIYDYFIQTHKTPASKYRHRKSQNIERQIKSKLKLEEINKKNYLCTKQHAQSSKIEKVFNQNKIKYERNTEEAILTLKHIKNNQQKEVKMLQKSFNKIWNQILLHEALDLYLQKKSFALIKSHLTQKYAQYGSQINVIFIRNKFNRIFRLAFKKIDSWLHQIGPDKVPQLITLNEYKINYIMTYDHAFDIRIRLLQIIKHKEINLHLLETTILSINDFVQKFINPSRTAKASIIKKQSTS